MTGVPDERAHEQDYVDVLYARLDQLRERVAAELAGVRLAGPSGSPQNRSERDVFATMHEDRLAQLWSVEDRLAFGRLDHTDGQRRYVGRIGLSDDDQRQLLVDWRAPAARPFYRATPASPGDVVRRRHISTRGRKVVGLEDELLDVEHLTDDEASTLTGEGALLAAIGAARTGRMADIVATIQAEQDRIIRSELTGVLVVQGGPGTGKTAVALHRAAYLLYTHRELLGRSGVLVVGPNSLFLRYIEQVLPSLGETGVVMSTPGQLYPGLDAQTDDEPAVARVKGDIRMAAVVANAVHDRQRVPERARLLDVDGHQLVLEPHVVAAARGRARRGRKPHNVARHGFLLELLDHLANQLATALHTEMSSDTHDELVAELRDSRDVRRELNLAWMPLTPERLLTDLFADPARLASAAPDLSAAERALLHREPGAPWTVSDVPLLDEAAELLGEDDTSARLAAAAAAAERQAELEYARAVASMVGSTPAGMRASAEQIAERFADSGPVRTLAERAESDRSWAYGHVVVDEAQELSPMAWRVLMRRNPRRSMTVVGDVAQTGSAAGARSWNQVLDPYVEGRWRLEELTVNYRTPAQVMELASAVLDAAGIEARAPRSVREGERAPSGRKVAADDLETVADEVRAELDALGSGRMAVIVPGDRRDEVLAALAAALPEGSVGGGLSRLDSPVAVLSVTEAKGLEFDTVVLVDPAEIVDGSLRGPNDLYVAMTRPTQVLRVLYARDLPPGMESLSTA